MKNLTCIAALLISIPTLGQSELSINDTRNVNDLPNFISQKFRLDFKPRHIVGVPGSGEFSTNMTISPWRDNTAGFVHQLNFKDLVI